MTDRADLVRFIADTLYEHSRTLDLGLRHRESPYWTDLAGAVVDTMPAHHRDAIMMAVNYSIVQNTELQRQLEQAHTEQDRWRREAFRLAKLAGWSPLGSHVDQHDVELEFAGVGVEGVPLWERPVTPNDLQPAPNLGDSTQRCRYVVVAGSPDELCTMPVGHDCGIHDAPRTASQLVAEFHEVFGAGAEDYPDIMTQSKATIEMRCQLILEEAQEAVDAIRARDLVSAAKELGDLAYVTYGAARRFGIPLDAVVEAVHRSNMTKLDNNGKPSFRSDGKVLKGPNYQPPNIARVLQDAWKKKIATDTTMDSQLTGEPAWGENRPIHGYRT